VLLLVALGLTACGGEETRAPATQRPTPVPPTPTLRSTALPDVPEAPMLGDPERPIELLFAVSSSGAAQRTANELQRFLTDALEAEITVSLTTEASALEALCSGRPVAAWLSAFSFVKAYETCGVIPAFAVTRGTPPGVTIGTSTLIVGPRGETRLSSLAGKTFCRSAESDDTFATWVLPSLILNGEGIDPVTDLAAIRDMPDDLSLGAALLQGVCHAAAFVPSEYDSFLEKLAQRLSTEDNRILPRDIDERLSVLSEAGDVTYPAQEAEWQGYPENVIPYEVLAFAPDSALPEAWRVNISDSIKDFFANRTNGTARASGLLNASGVIAVDPEDFVAFRDLLARAKWDMTFAG